MRCHIWNPARFAPLGLVLLVWLVLARPAQSAESRPRRLAFADGRISCLLVAENEDKPDAVLAVLPMAMNTALEFIGPPDQPTRLTVRQQGSPTFLDRLKTFFRPAPAAVQQGDEILVSAGDEPLKLAFRLAHECSHWLVQQKHPAKPPLWLDEGLASLVGAAAADTCARVYKQTLDRPPPARLEQSLFRLDELAALHTYPETSDRSAAFYWQAEALVGAIRQKLGPVEFMTYLGLLCAPERPDWKAPLRERWYFSDWDLQALARQIQPSQAPAPARHDSP